ncbi:TrmB family transcriptional regulator [Halosolutus gelatinilyticus]|uniref:TrmB family transcriptional regulator n=1 Tax=Halosolutus gelatinilyticus TaxID=2931975 RepID=UPI001FF35169|nr:helix-turn-helix domain-containing protein [Halosolutus gelatinilyticus]
MPTEEQAVQFLESLGLTEYEARCFVALSRVPMATASQIANLSDVPRSRVYDAVDRLHRRGLVDVQQSEPRKYRAISSDAALESLKERYEASLDAAAEALSNLHRSKELEEKGAWAIADHEHVTDRIRSFLDEATDEVYVLVVADEAVDREFKADLASVTDGVTTLIEVPSRESKAELDDAVPAADVVVTDLADDPAMIEEKRLGRIIMVDRRSVLLGALTIGPRPGRYDETAIWASGPDHGLVVGLRHILGARIDDQNVFE